MDKFVKLGQDMVLLWSKYKVMYWAGIWNTLKLAFLATLIGCFIGLLCGVLNTIPYTKKDPLPKRFLLKLLRIIIRIYVEVFRGTPMVLQSVFIYYGLPYFSNNALRFDNIFAAALLIVAINTGAYMAESVRGGIISIDPGQTEGAKAIGMTPLRDSGVFPPLLYNMAAIGEETGNMEEMLEHAADFYEEEVENATKAVTAIMEPVIIVLMAGVVVPIMFAIMAPMMSMYTAAENA